MLHLPRFPFALLVALGTCTVLLHADTIFSNLGGTYIGGEDIGTADNRIYADQFTASETATLSDIQVEVASISSLTDIDVAVETDSGGVPGSVIESFTLNDVPLSDTLETVNSVLDPTLDAGTSYWVVVSAAPGGEATWVNSTIGDSGQVAFCDFSCSSWSTYTAPTNATREAFQVDGSPAGTPEPSTTLPLFAILLSAAVYRLKHFAF